MICFSFLFSYITYFDFSHEPLKVMDSNLTVILNMSSSCETINKKGGIDLGGMILYKS